MVMEKHCKTAGPGAGEPHDSGQSQSPDWHCDLLMVVDPWQLHMFLIKQTYRTIVPAVEDCDVMIPWLLCSVSRRDGHMMTTWWDASIPHDDNLENTRYLWKSILKRTLLIQIIRPLMTTLFLENVRFHFFYPVVFCVFYHLHTQNALIHDNIFNFQCKLIK